MVQDSRTTLKERLCFIEIQRQISPCGRDVMPVYRKLAASPPLLWAGTTTISVGRRDVLLQIRGYRQTGTYAPQTVETIRHPALTLPLLVPYGIRRQND
ncbi:hypothetical protein ASD05_28850 [Variovorax sp. Root434]|nr:hypothetical protein ASD05_28850 [Variovorax sp. Root434]